MCKCVNVQMGSFANQVVLSIPEHMKQYRDNRVADGLSPNVCIDRCIAEEIKHLWSLGIHTRGSCCGHNKQSGMINVADESINKMFILGYKEYPNPAHAEYGKPFTFYTKTDGTFHGDPNCMDDFARLDFYFIEFKREILKPLIRLKDWLSKRYLDYGNGKS